MNQNDMDRYFWRTGQRWSGDSRSIETLRGEFKIPARTLVLLFIVFLITTVMLLWPRGA